jgi:hypothetical protein
MKNKNITFGTISKDNKGSEVNKLLLFLFIFNFQSLMAENCFNGKATPNNLTLEDVVEICDEREFTYDEAIKDLEKTFKSLDMNDPYQQKLWSMLLGMEHNFYVELSKNDWKFCNSCSEKAKKYFRCRQKQIKYNNAFLAFRAEYIEYDFSKVTDQHAWQALAPKLQAKLDFASSEFYYCH